MNKWIDKALETWYEKGNPLRFKKLHPALGLAGEAGELIDLYKKEKFKPEFDWMDCKHCGESNSSHREGYCYSSPFGESPQSPILYDEIGDLTYYARILFYQAHIPIPEPYRYDISTLESLTYINNIASKILSHVVKHDVIPVHYLSLIWRRIDVLCQSLDTSLEEVMELNWQKLKDGDNHGWKDAR